MEAVALGGGGERAGSTSKDSQERSKTLASFGVDHVPADTNAAHLRRASRDQVSKPNVVQDGSAIWSASPATLSKIESPCQLDFSELGSSGPVGNATTMSNGAGKGAIPVLPPNVLESGLKAARSRKGSLRKNILRKGGIQRMETIPSLRTDSSVASSTANANGNGSTSTSHEGKPTVMMSRRSSQGAERRDGLIVDAASALASPRWISTVEDTSTTDEDEKVPGSSSSNGLSVPGQNVLPRRSSGSAESYFPPQPEQLTGPRRRHSHMKLSRLTKSSPLSALPLDATSTGPLSPEAWDYGETERWGWIILVATWVTFVVGVGSCFGAWSWAWDVGKTPYAPPELEDDPTLPIVGYYPALLVLTGVMAWAWVIIAWVGMKYFKHAKMAGDDG